MEAGSTFHEEVTKQKGLKMCMLTYHTDHNNQSIGRISAVVGHLGEMVCSEVGRVV